MSKKLIRFDWAIKRLLRIKANFVVLEGFLSELLFDDIKIDRRNHIRTALPVVGSSKSMASVCG